VFPKNVLFFLVCTAAIQHASRLDASHPSLLASPPSPVAAPASDVAGPTRFVDSMNRLVAVNTRRSPGCHLTFFVLTDFSPLLPGVSEGHYIGSVNSVIWSPGDSVLKTPKCSQKLQVRKDSFWSCIAIFGCRFGISGWTFLLAQPPSQLLSLLKVHWNFCMTAALAEG